MNTSSLLLTTAAVLTLICGPADAQTQQTQSSDPSARVSGHSSIGAGAGHSPMGSTPATGTTTNAAPSTAPSTVPGVDGVTTTTTGTTAVTTPTNTNSGTQGATSGSISGNIQPETTTTTPATNTTTNADGTSTNGTVVPPNDTSVTGGTPGVTTPAVTTGATASGPATSSQAESNFNTYDTNKDGNLSKTEYTSLSSQINQPGDINISTPTTFTQIDADGNGSVSATEFKTYVDVHK